jgi:hypothetical protein
MTNEGHAYRQWNLSILPHRVGIDANVIIWALTPSSAKDPAAIAACEACEEIFKLMDSRTITLCAPIPALAEWWVANTDDSPPDGQHFEPIPFDLKAAKLMAQRLGVQTLSTIAHEQHLRKKCLKADAMILACLWSAKVKVFVSDNKSDFARLLKLVAPDQFISVLTPLEFLNQYSIVVNPNDPSESQEDLPF